jgi:hypothetical protein
MSNRQHMTSRAVALCSERNKPEGICTFICGRFQDLAASVAATSEIHTAAMLVLLILVQ